MTRVKWMKMDGWIDGRESGDLCETDSFDETEQFTAVLAETQIHKYMIFS